MVQPHPCSIEPTFLGLPYDVDAKQVHQAIKQEGWAIVLPDNASPELHGALETLIARLLIGANSFHLVA